MCELSVGVVLPMRLPPIVELPLPKPHPLFYMLMVSMRKGDWAANTTGLRGARR